MSNYEKYVFSADMKKSSLGRFIPFLRDSIPEVFSSLQISSPKKFIIWPSAKYIEFHRIWRIG